MKKILFFINAENVGGVEKRFSYLFNHLASKKELEEKAVFLINTNLRKKINAYLTDIKNDNVFVRFFGVDLGGGTRVIKATERLFETIHIALLSLVFMENYDLIVFVTSRSRKFRKIFKAQRKVIVFYGSVSSGKETYRKFYNGLIRDGYIFDCLSQNIARSIQSAVGKKQMKIFTSPGSFIDYSNTDCDFSGKENAVSFAGRFTESKGVHLLLDVVKQVLEKNQNLHFFILGYGSLEREIKSFIERHDLCRNVSVLYTAEPKNYLKKTKIFLSLQAVDNYPSQSLIEAMACKNYIIATDVGLTYKLVNNYTGLRVKPDSRMIQEAIIDGFNNQEILKEKGDAARQYVMKDHSVENYYRYLKSFLNNQEALL